MTFKRHAAWLWLTSQKWNPFTRRSLAKPVGNSQRYTLAMYKLMAFTGVDCSPSDEDLKWIRNFSAIHMEVRNASIRNSNPSQQHGSQDTLRLAWPHPLVIGVFAVLPAEELPKAARVNDRHDVDLNHLFTKSACHGAPVLGETAV